MSKRPGKQASISDFFAKASKPTSESTHSTTCPNIEFSDLYLNFKFDFYNFLRAKRAKITLRAAKPRAQNFAPPIKNPWENH